MASLDPREVDALRQSYESLVEAIEGSADDQGALEISNYLAETLQGMSNSAAEVRARMMAKIWEKEKLTLAALGARVGVSRARAGQILQTAKRSMEKQAEGGSNG